MSLTLFGCAVLAHFLFNYLKDIFKGFLTFAKHVMGWASKMFRNLADALKRGLSRIVVVEVPAKKIPPDILSDILSKSKLDGATKVRLGDLDSVPLGVETDREATPLAVHSAFVPTHGMDREFRQHLDEGGGVIEFCS